MTLGANGSNLTKLFHVTCRETGVIIWEQLLTDPPPKIWEGKTSKIRRVFSDNFWLWSRISSERIDNTKIKKNIWSTTTPPMFGEKVERWSTNQKITDARISGKLLYIMLSSKGCCLLEYRRYNPVHRLSTLSDLQKSQYPLILVKIQKNQHDCGG